MNKSKKILQNFENAKQSIAEIQQINIDEIRLLKICPQSIFQVLTTLLILFDVYDFSWCSIKNFLKNPNFKNKILNFNINNITPAKRLHVFNYIINNSQSFDLENLQKISTTTALIANWIKTIVLYANFLDMTRIK